MEVWQYDFVDLYHGPLTLEFMPSAKFAVRIASPAPFSFAGGTQSDAAGIATLATALGRELKQDTSASPRSGLTARIETSLRINRVEQFMNLVVPMESFSGLVDLIGQVTVATPDGSKGMVVANVRDFFDAAPGEYQTAFTLLPGPYVCNLLVRERATGVMYSQSIPFQVSK